MELLHTLLTMPGHEIVTLLGYMTMVSVVVDKAGTVIEVMVKRHKEAKIRRIKESRVTQGFVKVIDRQQMV